MRTGGVLEGGLGGVFLGKGEGTYVEQHAEVGGCGQRGHDDEVCGRGGGQGGDGGGDGEFHGCVLFFFLLMKKDLRRRWRLSDQKRNMIMKQKDSEQQREVDMYAGPDIETRTVWAGGSQPMYVHTKLSHAPQSRALTYVRSTAPTHPPRQTHQPFLVEGREPRPGSPKQDEAEQQQLA